MTAKPMPGNQRARPLTCDRCCTGFQTIRFNARFCSNACRQAAYRQRLKKRRSEIPNVTRDVH